MKNHRKNYDLFTRNEGDSGIGEILPEVMIFKYHQEGEYFAESLNWIVYKRFIIPKKTVCKVENISPAILAFVF